MIVLDENLDDGLVINAISRWYRGKVVAINELRPATLIKDDNIASLLHQVDRPLFVTINATDFCLQIPPHHGYCIVTFSFATPRINEISALLRQLFRVKEFSTRKSRMGLIFQLSRGGYTFYTQSQPAQRREWNI